MDAIKLVSVFLLLLNNAIAEKSSDFISKKNVDGVELKLNGTGMRKATFLGIQVYKAGLYLKNTTNKADEVLAQELPKSIDLRFLREVDAGKIREAWSESIKKNNDNFSALSAKVEELNKAMKDLKENDELSFNFLKNKTTKVTLNGSELVIVKGDEFQSALLRVWMGPNPPNEELKSGLLSLK